MNGREKSDGLIVPKSLPNEETGGPVLKEEGEGRGLGKGNSFRQTRDRTQSRGTLSNAMERVRQAAEREKEQRFTALWHHVYNREHLREAYRDLKRNAAPGIDGETWYGYGQNLEEHLRDLSERLKRGAYRAHPVKRVYIPKADGRLRPIGITTLEDKLVQRVTAQVLESIWEVDFKGFSYGFRPKRSAHDALDALTVGVTHRKVNWVLDADIQGFFETIDHEWLVKFIEHRIADKRVIRHIRKWLKAGVMEEGQRRPSEEGTPQGGSISPLLANLYLHYVFDLWVDHWRRRKATGEVIVVRYADDFVVGFQHREDADRFLRELRDRLSRFHLRLHEEKTRLIEFGRFAACRRKARGQGKPETFNFLGFTFLCGKTRNGKFQVIRRTNRKGLWGKLKSLKEELRKRMHDPIPGTGQWLRRVLHGHYQYFGVPLNGRALATFYQEVIKAWFRALQRRSQKGRLNWERMRRIAKRWLPTPRIVHPYPDQRLHVRTQARSPVR